MPLLLYTIHIETKIFNEEIPVTFEFDIGKGKIWLKAEKM